ncbi:MAG TPA: hypothetical protein VF021_05395 [Longimicrobiales bacterium]
MEIAVIAAIAIAAIGIVILPLLRRSQAHAGTHLTETEIDAEVARYRAAIKGHTLCERCLAANPEGSRFCGECGREL